jgi:hypothetical protein
MFLPLNSGDRRMQVLLALILRTAPTVIAASTDCQTPSQNFAKQGQKTTVPGWSAAAVWRGIALLAVPPFDPKETAMTVGFPEGVLPPQSPITQSRHILENSIVLLSRLTK